MAGSFRLGGGAGNAERQLPAAPIRRSHATYELVVLGSVGLLWGRCESLDPLVSSFLFPVRVRQDRDPVLRYHDIWPWAWCVPVHCGGCYAVKHSDLYSWEMDIRRDLR